MKKIKVSCSGAALVEQGFKKIATSQTHYVNSEGIAVNTSKHASTKFITTKYLDKDGYHRIWIKNHKGERKFVPIHREVAKIFVDGYDEGLVVNHKDGIRTNNQASNLEWITAADNTRYSRRVLKNIPRGEKASRSRLKAEQVKKIYEEWHNSKDRHITKKLATQYGVSRSQITRIITKKNWGHLWV